MMRVLSRHFGWVKFGGVGLVVFFAGSALTTHFTSKLLLDVSSVAQAATEADEDPFAGDEDDEEATLAKVNAAQKLNDRALAGMAGKSTRKQQAADGIVAANVFCPTCTPVAHEDQPLLASAGPMQVGETQSTLPLRLLATMESDDPAYSMATILQTDTNVLAPYGVNDTIRAGVVVQRVDRGRVVFRNGAQMEYIDIGGMPPPVTSVVTPIEPIEEAGPEKSDREIDGAAEAITCDAEFTSCTVDKAFVEKLLSNPAQLTRQARIVPAVRDGETKGYKFYGIRPGSLPRLLGMKNGDLLTSVNGHQLESLDQAMDLYTKLRRASHLSVTIERQGEVVQKEIDIK